MTARRLEDVSHYFLDRDARTLPPASTHPSRPRVIHFVSVSDRVVGAMVVSGMAIAVTRGGRSVVAASLSAHPFDVGFGLGVVSFDRSALLPIVETASGVGFLAAAGEGYLPVYSCDPDLGRILANRIAQSDMVFVHLTGADAILPQGDLEVADELIVIIDDPTEERVLDAYRAIKYAVACNAAVLIRLVLHGRRAHPDVAWARLVDGVERFLDRECWIVGSIDDEALAAAFLSGAFFERGWEEIAKTLAPLGSRWLGTEDGWGLSWRNTRPSGALSPAFDPSTRLT